MAVQAPKRLFTVREFHQMAEGGVFHEDDRVELLAGEVVQMTPIGARHAGCVKRLNALLSALVRGIAVVSVQDPLDLDDRSEPQPDLALLRSRSDFYADFHPRPLDVLLVIEVADTSGEYDRAVKVPLYARAGIPEVWVIDLAARAVDVYRQPSPDGYQDHRRRGGDDRLSSDRVPTLDVTVGQVLG